MSKEHVPDDHQRWSWPMMEIKSRNTNPDTEDHDHDAEQLTTPTCTPFNDEESRCQSSEHQMCNFEDRTSGKQSEKVFSPILPIPDQWNFLNLSKKQTEPYMTGVPVRDNGNFPELRGIQHKFIRNTVESHGRAILGMAKGWPGPGPGPRTKVSKIGNIRNLRPVSMYCVLHEVRKSLQFQEYNLPNSSQDSVRSPNLSDQISILEKIENVVPLSQVAKKKIWILSAQLGVPSILFKLPSPDHSIAIYLGSNPADTTAEVGLTRWKCSHCLRTELGSGGMCDHSHTVSRCIQEVSSALEINEEQLLDMMMQTAAFEFDSDIGSIGFYGDEKKFEFAVVRSGYGNLAASLSSRETLQILKFIPRSRKWKCLAGSCKGISSTCGHSQLARSASIRKLQIAGYNLFLLQKSSEGTYRNLELDVIANATHKRNLIPSEKAFRFDDELNIDSHFRETKLLPFSKFCHCGLSVSDVGSSELQEVDLRIENNRNHATYKQLIWKCCNGHVVTPEEDEGTRDGIVWISKSTAYTEVFLFDTLLHLSLCGATISGQSDIRFQLMTMRQKYASSTSSPRSNPCVRKALAKYAASVVPSIPDWVFRCSNCATYTDGGYYYEKLSFDGQQLGFNLRQDVTHEFYGQRDITWRQPVDRPSRAWALAHLIESQSLRKIVIEALRVREVPKGCNSVQVLCRSMMRIPLGTKENIRSAVAALKLFDPFWNQRTPAPITAVNLSSPQAFHSSILGTECAHPLQYIVGEEMSEGGFERGMIILNIFKDALDSTKAAAILAVLLTDLRADLSTFISSHDMSWLQQYRTYAVLLLRDWLNIMSNSVYWKTSVTSVTSQVPQTVVDEGISEHASILTHPYRSPLSWRRFDGDSLQRDSSEQNIQFMLSNIRTVGIWTCPKEGVNRILLLTMAILNEPVSVWLRNSTFTIIDKSSSLLMTAGNVCGRGDVSEWYDNYLNDLVGSTLVYEGIMSLIGANVIEAETLLSSFSSLLRLVKKRFEDYSAEMTTFSPRDQSRMSPQDFDTVLRRTSETTASSSVGNSTTRVEEDGTHIGNIESTYDKAASCHDDQFLMTGVWAPDFPLRRPSPYNITPTKPSTDEESCSKNYDVHTAFSPGTFGAYCLCKHSKAIAVIFLKQPEGCRMPLNFMIQRCLKMPSYVIYDFACGTQKAALSLSREVTMRTRFVIDPFHFVGHKSCSLAMHQSNYAELDSCNSESQEQRNGRVKLMQNTLRACKDTHFMHFMILTHAYLNLKAMYLDVHGNRQRNGSSNTWISWAREKLDGYLNNGGSG